MPGTPEQLFERARRRDDVLPRLPDEVRRGNLDALAAAMHA